MISEFDLPCSACGSELRAVTIEPDELAVRTGGETSVVVAECRTCGERHYPEQTLSALRGGPSSDP